MVTINSSKSVSSSLSFDLVGGGRQEAGSITSLISNLFKHDKSLFLPKFRFGGERRGQYFKFAHCYPSKHIVYVMIPFLLIQECRLSQVKG